jgi:hypothetical protein
MASYFDVNKLINGKLQDYPQSLGKTSFEEVSSAWYNKGASVFSTVKVGLFIAKFDQDFSNTNSFTTSLNPHTSGSSCTLTYTAAAFTEAFC